MSLDVPGLAENSRLFPKKPEVQMRLHLQSRDALLADFRSANCFLLPESRVTTYGILLTTTTAGSPCRKVKSRSHVYLVLVDHKQS